MSDSKAEDESLNAAGVASSQNEAAQDGDDSNQTENTETREKGDDEVECVNQSGDGTDEDSRKLFVRSLNWNTRADTLKKYCEKYGEVEKCEIKTHPTGESRGFAFVVFKTVASLNAILAEPRHSLDSRNIELKEANKREIITKVFVGGLNRDATDEQIREHFEQFGKIEQIDVPVDANNKRRGFCFVNYETEDGMKKATERRIQKLCGKECEVKKTTPKGRGQDRGGRGAWGGYPRGGYSQYPSYGGYGGYSAYPGYDAGYDYYGGYGGWSYDPYGYDPYGGQQSGFGKTRDRGRPGYRPY